MHGSAVHSRVHHLEPFGSAQKFFFPPPMSCLKALEAPVEIVPQSKNVFETNSHGGLFKAPTKKMQVFARSTWNAFKRFN